MSRLRIYLSVLATLAVGGLGWIGWQQQRLLERSTTQTCLARAQAQIDVFAGALALVGSSGEPDARTKLFTSLSNDADRRIKACH